MIKQSRLLTIGAFVFSASCFPGRSQCAPAPPPIPAVAVFAGTGCDGAPSRVTGDGAPYEDGVGGVECNFSRVTGDFRLNLHFTNRYLNFDLTSPAPTPAGCIVQPPATPIPSYLSASAFMNVNGLYNVLQGTGWHSVGAAFLTWTVGDLRFSPYLPGYCSTHVLAQHPDPGTWEVCSEPPGNGTAVLVQSSKNQSFPVGYFNLPFHLTVTLQ